MKSGISQVRVVFGIVFVAVFLSVNIRADESDFPSPPVAWTDITLLEGTPVLVGPDSSQQALVLGQRLYAGSVLQTDGASRLELTFPNGDVVRMAEKTTIELGVEATDAEEPEPRFQVALIDGNVWINLSGRLRSAGLQLLAAGAVFSGTEGVFRAAMFPKGDVEVKTYTGEITADGPFEIVKEDGRYTLRPLPKRDDKAVEPWRHQMEAYRKMIVLSSGEATPPFRFAARSDMTKWVRWNQQQDEGER